MFLKIKMEHSVGIEPTLRLYEGRVIPLDQPCKSGLPERS